VRYRRPRQKTPKAGRRALRAPKISLPKFDARARKVSLAVIAMAAAMTGGFWLYNSPVLALHGVKVEGNVVLSDDVVRQVADLKGQSIVRPGFAGAQGRLTAFPLIKEAKVSRDWPFGAHVTVVERQAWGVWQIGDQRYVIDDEGVVLTLPEPQNAPAIVQTDPAGLLRPGDKVDASAVAVAKQLFATAQQSIGESVARLEFSQITGLSAVLADDVRVSFGGVDNYEFKLAALYAVLERAQEKGESVHAVDLRFGDRVAVE
jgi:cell division septal protein FtsQ